MRKRNIVACLLLALLLPLEIAAQQKDSVITLTKHYLDIGLGFTNHATRDKSTSPLIYEGFLPSLHLQYTLANSKFCGILDYDFGIGYLTTRNYPAYDGNQALSINNDFSVRPYFLVSHLSRKTAFFLGADLGFMANVRLNNKFNNASFNYDFFLTMAPSAMFQIQSAWKGRDVSIGFLRFHRRDRNLKFQYALSMPVVTNALRPSYTGVSDFVDNNTSDISMQNVKTVTFNQFFMVNNRFSVYYILNNSNMLKLDYTFLYYNYHPAYNTLQGFKSALMFSIVFNFSKH